MKYILPAIMAVLALGLLASPTQARMRMQSMKPHATTPEQFIQAVASSNEFEIQSSKLALDKSKNEEIHQFGNRMIEDHTKLGDELKATLKQANMPEPDNRLDPKDQAQLDKLRKLSGAAFDRTYVADQRAGHVQAVRLVGVYAKDGTNPALKGLAVKSLPILKEHLRMAEGLRTGRNLTARR